MRSHLPRTAVLLLIGTCLLALLPGYAGAVLVVFKDGFLLQGRITQPKEFVVDKLAGVAFTVPVSGAPYSIDDEARRILFSPNQVHDVLKDDPAKSGDLITLKLFSPQGREPLPSSKDLEEVGAWNDRWERALKFNTVRGQLTVDQRVTLLTPRLMRVEALRYDFVPYYLTREFDLDTVRGLLNSYYAKKKEPEIEKKLQIARFLIQAGWTEQVEGELKDLLKDNPKLQEKIEPLLEGLKKTRATEFLDALELADKAGRYEEVQQRIDGFFKRAMSDVVSPKQLLQVQEIKSKLEAAQEQLKLARTFLKELPERIPPLRRTGLSEACATILEELTPDTLPRLETFLSQAQDHELALKQKRRPNQTPETLLAFALSGWVLGNAAAEENVETALQLWQTRRMVLEYQKTEGAVERQKMFAYPARGGLAPDVVARLIRLLPPPTPYDKIDTDPVRLETEVLDQQRPSSYYVQLPPEYNHSRPYPVLLVLHQGDEKPLAMLKRWSELAAGHGYILAAPAWGSGFSARYGYSAREHATVVDCLRDLRRRFQVDSDRVFLFGAEQGGLMAYDVGLAHPDLFAGVLTMSAPPVYYPARYWPNGQYLPFYVVDGERNGTSPKLNRNLFMDWVRWQYPSLYVEYRGRGKEWFEGELPQMMDWMGRKKRAHPLRELGREREEFKTLRATDNRFYWLSTDHVLERYQRDLSAWSNQALPAALQATIFAANQINVRASGVSQVTVWLGPGSINFADKVTVRLNSNQVGAAAVIRPSLETLLEDFWRQGDRQQLYLARIDLRL